jgi:predicted RNA binding protein YcfA (HicA-like mRNA interferase family)
VYYLEAKNITVPVPRHPGNVPIGTLRAIVREAGMTVEEFNAL